MKNCRIKKYGEKNKFLNRIQKSIQENPRNEYRKKSPEKDTRKEEKGENNGKRISGTKGGWMSKNVKSMGYFCKGRQ